MVAEAALRREEEGLPSNKYQIIVVELNEATSVKSFFRNILKALDDSHWNNKHDTIDDLEDRIHHFCRELGVQGLVGGEVQHLDKKSSDATGVTNRLKSFLNRGIVPLILVGNEKAEAFFEKNTDLAARLGTPLVLKPLDPRNDRTDRKLFTAFCKKLDASMVKAKIVDEPAGLDEPGLRSQLVAVSGGHVGRVCRVVCEATIHALWRGSPKVEKHDLSVATRRYASRSSIMLGELRMPRPAFDFLHRRIGPHSLKERPHHRSAWLNRLLPYCPESFEHLVEACSKCGPLGWRRTRGIGHCESCAQPVPASDLPRLPERLALDYRLAADLMSRDPAAGRRALKLLPNCLQTFSRTTLVDMMLKSGIMASELPTRWELDQLRSQSSEMVAGIVANGAAILRSWPTGIRDVVTRRMGTNVDDLVAYEEVRTEVRWIAKYSGDEGQAILDLAFPHLDGRTAETFSSAARFYTATETNQRLWSSSVELGKLREADAIRFESLPSRQRLRARYDADDVDELHRQLHAGETPGAAAGRFDLPVYAVGQLVTSGRLEIMPHPGVQVLRGYLIDRGLAEQLEGALTHGAKLPANRPVWSRCATQ